MAVVADELLLVVKSNVTQALAGLSAVEAKAGGLGGAVASGARMAAGAVLGVAAAAGVVGVASAKMAMDFGRDMAQIEALVGVPKDEMAELRDAALNMGSQFGVSAREAAGGLFFLKSAGLETSDAIATLESTAMASAMGLGEMKDLANTATTAMTNFGLEATEAYDNIAMAAKLAKADPAELGRIMNQNSSAAALVGMSYDDVGATLALLTRKFGDADKAGTGMEGILRKLIKPSQMATDALAEIGVSAQDFQKILAEDLPGGLHALDEAFAAQGITQSEWLGQVFEDGEAIKAAAAVIQTSGAEIEEVFAGMDSAAGTLANGWGVMEETASVKWSKAAESIKSALIPVGDIILTYAIPAIVKLAEWLGKGVEWLHNFLSSAQGAGDGLKRVFDILFYSIVSIADLRKFWVENHDAIVGSMAAFGESVKAIWDSIYQVIGPVVEDMVKFIVDTFSGLRQWWDENWGLIRNTLEVVGGLILRIWTRTWDAIKDHIMPLWEAIKRIITGAVNIIKGVIQFVMAVITGDWGKAWDALKDIVKGAWDIIVGVVLGAWEILKTTWDLALAGLKSAWDIFWSLLGNAITAVWDGIVAGFKGGINLVIGALEWGINKAISLINGAITSFNKIPLVPNMPTINPVSIPGLAKGGTTLTRGGVLVGERGPELLDLPRGARVTPLSGADKAGGVHIENLTVTGGGDAREIAAEIGWQLLLQGAA